MQHKNFGKFVLNKRISLSPKISLNKFALNNGIEPATLSRIENVKQDLTLDTLYKIAAGFGVKASILLDEYEISSFYP